MKLRYLPLMLVLFACGRPPNALNMGLPECLPEEDGKRWDLGTGSAYDARRFGPGFLALREPGWKEPLQGWPAEQARVDRERFNEANGRRYRALRIAANGVDRQVVRIDDVEAFHLVVAPIERPRVRRFTLRDERPVIMITPGTCPHVYAANSCQDGRLMTTITTEGTVKCVGVFTVGDSLLIASSKDGPKVPMIVGKPLLTGTHDPTFYMFSPDGKPLGQASQQLNDFADASPEEVVAALELGDERPAVQLIKNVPSELLTKDVKAKIRSVRLEAAKRAAASVDSPEKAWELAARPFLNDTLPGDGEVRELTRAKVIEGSKLITDPTLETFKIAMNLVKAIRFFRGSDADVASTGLDNVFGPKFVDGTLADPKDRVAFISAFPTSEQTKKLQARTSAEIELNNAEERARWAMAELDADFAALAEKSDQIVTTRWQADMVLRNLSMMRNPHRSRAGAEAFKREADRIQREEFCPAKKAFLKKWGTDDLKPRVKQKCDQEPPTATGEFGRQVTLDKECRAIFVSGC